MTELCCSSDEGPGWVEIAMLSWLEFEPMSGFFKGINIFLVGAKIRANYNYLKLNQKY